MKVIIDEGYVMRHILSFKMGPFSSIRPFKSMRPALWTLALWMLALCLGAYVMLLPLSSLMPAYGQTSEVEAENAVSNADEADTDATEIKASTPQAVAFRAKLSEGGDVLNGGLIWRIFKDKSAEGQAPELHGTLQDPVAEVELKPGDYIVHLSYGHATLSSRFTVQNKPIDQTFTLDAGGIKLAGALAGEVKLPIDKQSFDIFSQDDPDRPLISNLPPDTVIRLNSGTYQVVARFGKINAVVRADIQVDPGQLTEAVLYHKASIVHFKLVSEAGGEAIAGTSWVIEDMDGKVLYEEVGAFPTTILAEGEYLVLVKQGEKAFSRRVKIKTALSQNIEILASY